MSKVASSNEHVSYAARSDVGMKRPQNQDSFDTEVQDVAGWPQSGYRFLVADGMGAHAAGELASQLAVDQVRHFYATNAVDPRVAVAQALKDANKHIFERGQADPQLYNMGTTCSSLVLLPKGALVGHVGDSRIYRCRGERIQQLTFDHSLVWEMRAAGQLRGDDENTAVPKNVITRCLGPHAEVEIDIEGYFSVRKGDTFLLCSDGLTGRVMDEEIGAVIRYLDPSEAVDFLVDLANLRGGTDNITVIASRILSDELAADGEVKDTVVQSSGTHPAWWLLAGIGLVSALVGTQISQQPVTIAGCVTFAFGALGALAQWLRQGDKNRAKGLPISPYVTANAYVNPNFVNGICATLDAMATAFPELKIAEELTSLRELAARESGPLSDSESARVCRRFAAIARQLRQKV